MDVGGGVRQTDFGRLDWEGKKGAEFGGDGGRCSASEEGGKEFGSNGRFYQRKVFRYIWHYALKVLPLVLVGLLEAHKGCRG